MNSNLLRIPFVIAFFVSTITASRQAGAVPPLSGPLRQNATIPAPSRGSSGTSSGTQGTVRRFSRGGIEFTPRPVTPLPIRPINPQPFVPVRPIYPPNYVQPVNPPTYTPGYVQPVTPIQPVTPATVLKPNVVTTLPIKVPRQFSPLEGRITEITAREAKCYTLEIAELVNTRLTLVIDDLRASGIDVLGMQKQVDTTRQMLTSKAPWRDIEPMLKTLMQAETGAFPRKLVHDLQQIRQLAMIRDALLVIAGAPPRVRSGPLPISAIPVGLIWILLDPSLPVGTGLFVNDSILVVGSGGQGELAIVKESVAAALGLPVVSGNPLPNIGVTEAVSLKNPIVISHQPDATSSLNYILNGRYSYSIEPGHTQKLANQTWNIQFDRGSGRGPAQYSLSQGSYEFRIVNGAWDLVRLQFDMTIDNRQGTQDFQFVAADKILTVKAGETQVYSGSEPLVVKFDRGEGPDQAVAKNLNKSGTYKVAVNTQTNLLDLYAMSDTGTETAITP